MARILPEVPPEKMTLKARQFLFVTSTYFLAMGLSMVFLPDRFSSTSFDFVAKQVPCGLNGWATVHIVVSVLALWAATRGKELAAWWALILGAALLGAWTYSFARAVPLSPTNAVSAVWAYGSLCLILLTQARQPLRAPFDPLLRAIPEPEIK